jgi:hypothetical protein
LALASSAGSLHACANKRTGALRLASQCKGKERSLTWNVPGAAGRLGEAGPQGGIGPQGGRGTRGVAASALAYAHVLWNTSSGSASIDPALSSGMGSTTVVYRPPLFCFGHLPFTPHIVQVNVDYALHSYVNAQVAMVSPTAGVPVNGCFPDEYVAVFTGDPSAGKPSGSAPAPSTSSFAMVFN